MRRPPIKTLASGLSAAVALTLAVGAGAQMPSPPAAPLFTDSPQATLMTGDDLYGAKGVLRPGDGKSECQAMMTKNQEMQDKIEAMDATLDELVAEMNATKICDEADAMDKPMAAVLTELVAQRKASRAMMMEMQPEMMAHMRHHMDMKMSGAVSGIDCPMMKLDTARD